MKPIQELIRLKNTLKNDIDNKQSDSMFLSTVRNAENKLHLLRDRLETVDILLKNYIVLQWLYDSNISDNDVLDTEK
jgi:hypothetical protein